MPVVVCIDYLPTVISDFQIAAYLEVGSHCGIA